MFDRVRTPALDRRRFDRVRWAGVVCVAMVVVAWAFATRGHADAPPGRYSFLGTEIVLDTKTALTWQWATAPGANTWEQAGQYCQSLNLSGSGWRLPSMKELQTIVDIARNSPAIDLTVFPGTMSGQYWTSSPSAGASTEAWMVDFQSGAANTTGRGGSNWVRCVR